MENMKDGIARITITMRILIRIQLKFIPRKEVCQMNKEKKRKLICFIIYLSMDK